VKKWNPTNRITKNDSCYVCNFNGVFSCPNFTISYLQEAQTLITIDTALDPGANIVVESSWIDPYIRSLTASLSSRISLYKRLLCYQCHSDGGPLLMFKLLILKFDNAAEYQPIESMLIFLFSKLIKAQRIYLSI